MILQNNNLMCTGKPNPRPYTLNSGVSGVSYKVELSDGNGTVSLPVDGESTYSIFEPWKMYNVGIEITQTANNDRITTRARVVSAVVVEE